MGSTPLSVTKSLSHLFALSSGLAYKRQGFDSTRCVRSHLDLGRRFLSIDTNSPHTTLKRHDPFFRQESSFSKGKCFTQYFIRNRAYCLPGSPILPDAPSSPSCLGIFSSQWLRWDGREPECISPPFPNADHISLPTAMRLPREASTSLTHPCWQASHNGMGRGLGYISHRLHGGD